MIDVAPAAASVPNVVHAVAPVVLYWATKAVSSEDASVQERSALVAEASAAKRPVGAAGGIVSLTTALLVEPCAFTASTRTSYVVLAERPVTVAVAAFAARVASAAQTPFTGLRSTRKPVSLDDLSIQVTSTLVEPEALTDRFEGALGAPTWSSAATSLGEDRPLISCFANTRNSTFAPEVRPVTVSEVSSVSASSANRRHDAGGSATVLYSATKLVSSFDSSVQVSSALVADARLASRPVGGGGGMVSATASLSAASLPLSVRTRNWYGALGASPLRFAVSLSAAGSARVTQSAFSPRSWTAKPVSSADSSTQVTVAEVDPVGVTVSSDGALGSLKVSKPTQFAPSADVPMPG